MDREGVFEISPTLKSYEYLLGEFFTYTLPCCNYALFNNVKLPPFYQKDPLLTLIFLF